MWWPMTSVEQSPFELISSHKPREPDCVIGTASPVSSTGFWISEVVRRVEPPSNRYLNHASASAIGFRYGSGPVAIHRRVAWTIHARDSNHTPCSEVWTAIVSFSRSFAESAELASPRWRTSPTAANWLTKANAAATSGP